MLDWGYAEDDVEGDGDEKAATTDSNGSGEGETPEVLLFQRWRRIVGAEQRERARRRGVLEDGPGQT